MLHDRWQYYILSNLTLSKKPKIKTEGKNLEDSVATTIPTPGKNSI
jgi:hypothetical protein